MAMSGFRGRVLGWGLLGYCGLALAQPAEVPEGYRIAVSYTHLRAHET